jgi:hypothetical protein
MALIQVQRKESVFGAARTVSVEDNGKVVGAVANGDSLAWERPEGEMRLTLTPSFGVVHQGISPLIRGVKTGEVHKYHLEWSWGAGSFILNPAH